MATDEGRQTIPYVKVTYPDGKEKEFVAADTTDQMIRDGVRRSMDCMDCHNTVGHPIAPTPEKGVDSVIAGGQVSRQLPYVRREAIRMLKESYPTQEEGAAAIDRGVRSLYASHSGGIDPREVDRTVAALQDLYRRNVFPAMKVQWGTYPNNQGHVTSMGCFRCHDESHTASDKSTISGDCGLCHTQLESPF